MSHYLFHVCGFCLTLSLCLECSPDLLTLPSHHPPLFLLLLFFHVFYWDVSSSRKLFLKSQAHSYGYPPSLAFIWIKCLTFVFPQQSEIPLLRYQAGSQRKEMAYSNEDDSRRCRGTIRDGRGTQVSNSGAGTNSKSKETRRESGLKSLDRENHWEKITWWGMVTFAW